MFSQFLTVCYSFFGMAIPKDVQLPAKGLPETPGVYLMYSETGEVIYVGKAVNLKRRVQSYWREAEAISRPQVADLIREVRSIRVEETPTVLEALIHEANKIKEFMPRYNIMQKDSKSFLYLVVTNDEYPRFLTIRGHDLAKTSEKKFKAVFGPYVNPTALRAALKLIRKIFPWSSCFPNQKRSCFEYHIHLCPGVCIEAISKKDYNRIVRNVILFFEGRTKSLLKKLTKEMEVAAKSEQFEKAAEARNQISALEHIQDVAVLTREDSSFFGYPQKANLSINIFGRIEGYDISNISGTSAVGSMVVFEDGEPAKKEYRKFKIRTVKGANDYAMLEEVLHRRFKKSEDGKLRWKEPDLLLIDGGLGQVGVVARVLRETGKVIPIIGIAKGFDRKQDQMVFDHSNQDLAKVAMQYKEILQRVRDEAHRFAITYHRKVRGKRK